MEQVERAGRIAGQIRDALEGAMGLARELSASMTSLAPGPLFLAATRRDELHATLSALTQELGETLSEVARKRGWQEVTLPRLAALAPQATERLSRALDQVRDRAAELRELDSRNRAKGLRTLGWLRSVLGNPEGGSSSYDRRGQAVAPGKLSTSNRAL